MLNLNNCKDGYAQWNSTKFLSYVLIISYKGKSSRLFYFACRGEDYNQHTKCISEEEKYSGKNYVPKSGANKGEQKQNQWLEVYNLIQIRFLILALTMHRNI